jgi:predicted transcriptional regulator
MIENTKIYEILVDDNLPLPLPRKPQNGRMELPYVFMGDEAFTLLENFLKPFSQKGLNTEKKIFNYRLSSSRIIVKNFLGIVASRFRIFHTHINLKLDRKETAVALCITICLADAISSNKRKEARRISKETKMYLFRYRKDLAVIMVNKQE